jgi:hypothetical protein
MSDTTATESHLRQQPRRLRLVVANSLSEEVHTTALVVERFKPSADLVTGIYDFIEHMEELNNHIPGDTDDRFRMLPESNEQMLRVRELLSEACRLMVAVANVEAPRLEQWLQDTVTDSHPPQRTTRPPSRGLSFVLQNPRNRVRRSGP